MDPYGSLAESSGKWLKANFHSHAGTGEGTCGAYEAEDVIKLYAEAGYEVLCVSNHDYFLDTKKLAEKHGILSLNGFEYSQDRHMLCVNTEDVIYGTHQQVIDECANQNGFVILCHPNWINKEYWPWKEIDKLKGYTGVEINNGVIYRLNGTGLATDTWDYLLSQGKLVWGFANDDFHRWYDLARTWNMIYSQSKVAVSINTAIQNGSFYASTGLILNEWNYSGGTIKVSASAKDTYIKEYEYVFIGKDGCTLDRQNAEHGEYHLTGEEMYARVQVKSEHGAMLWTQPVYREALFRKP